MELRLNIVFSAVFHGMIFVASFLLVRGGTLSSMQPAPPLNVSFFEERSENAAPRLIIARKETNMVGQNLPNPVQKEKLKKAVADRDEKHELRPLQPHAPAEPPGTKIPRDAGRIDHAAPGNPSAPASNTAPAKVSELLQSAPQSTAVFLNAADTPATGKSIAHGGAAGIPDAIAAIRRALERAKSYPPVAKKRGIQGTVTASFAINVRGFPEDIRIVKTSGYEVLDTAAWDTVQKAAPFPAVQGVIEVPITFMLR